VVNQKPPRQADREVGDGKHARLLPLAAANATGRGQKNPAAIRLLWALVGVACFVLFAEFLQQMEEMGRRAQRVGFKLRCSRSPTASQIDRLVRTSKGKKGSTIFGMAIFGKQVMP
jgi:hypothetical protein